MAVVQGEVDLAKLTSFAGIFEPLLDESEFAKLQVYPKVGIIVWPTGGHLDPDVLYATVTGEPIDLA